MRQGTAILTFLAFGPEISYLCLARGQAATGLPSIHTAGRALSTEKRAFRPPESTYPCSVIHYFALKKHYFAAKNHYLLFEGHAFQL